MARVRQLRAISIASYFRRLLVSGVRLAVAPAFVQFFSIQQFLFHGMVDPVAECSGELALLRKRGIKGGLLQIDYENAFPSLFWGFIRKIMERTGAERWFQNFHWRSYRRAYHRFCRGRHFHVGLWIWWGGMQGDALAICTSYV